MVRVGKGRRARVMRVTHTHSRFPELFNLRSVLSLYLITGRINTDAEESRINEGRHERFAPRDETRPDETLKTYGLVRIRRSLLQPENEKDDRSYLLFAEGY